MSPLQYNLRLLLPHSPVQFPILNKTVRARLRNKKRLRVSRKTLRVNNLGKAQKDSMKFCTLQNMWCLLKIQIAQTAKSRWPSNRWWKSLLRTSWRAWSRKVVFFLSHPAILLVMRSDIWRTYSWHFFSLMVFKNNFDMLDLVFFGLVKKPDSRDCV